MHNASRWGFLYLRVIDMNGQHLRLMMGGPHIAGGSSKRRAVGGGGAYRFCIGDTNPDRTTVREHPYSKPSVTKLPDPYEALPYVLSASCSSNAWDAKLKSANYVQMARSPNFPIIRYSTYNYMYWPSSLSQCPGALSIHIVCHSDSFSTCIYRH